MRLLLTIALAAIAVSPPVFAQNSATQGATAAIRKVVSGKTCVGDDVLAFGQSTSGAPGTFDGLGHPEAMYAIGYGTILVLHRHHAHGYVASVSVSDHKLYLSTETYRCGR